MKRKKNTDIDKDTLTKYYKATYVQDEDWLMSEVFAESSMDRAQEYASGDNARGRQLIALTEHPDLYSAMMEEPGDTTNKQL